jgi:hypothetical protein
LEFKLAAAAKMPGPFKVHKCCLSVREFDPDPPPKKPSYDKAAWLKAKISRQAAGKTAREKHQTTLQIA